MAYLYAKRRSRSRYSHSAAIVPLRGEVGGCYLHLISNLEGRLLPAGASWHATEDDAKREALESMQIRPTDWVVRDGDLEWAALFEAGHLDAVARYLEARGDEPGPEGPGPS